MKPVRIVYNGEVYKVQTKGWFRWKDEGENHVYSEDMDIFWEPYLFETIEQATLHLESIVKEYRDEQARKNHGWKEILLVPPTHKERTWSIKYRREQ